MYVSSVLNNGYYCSYMHIHTHIIRKLRPYCNTIEILKFTMFVYSSLLYAVRCLGEDDITLMQKHSHLFSFLLFLYCINFEIILRRGQQMNRTEMLQ